MITTDCIIIGGGPAGLCAAKTALDSGLKVILFDRNHRLGGQLIKQTHKFFGSTHQYASMRGFDIAEKLIQDISSNPMCTLYTHATVVGLYPENVVTVLINQDYLRFQATSVCVATGASEKSLAFENNDLPGIYGAGAIQTLMNLYGVIPGKEVIMIGSGNIGLIVSYQLIQAGVTVKAVIEAAPAIGGYTVHASKLIRCGVPIYLSTTITKAYGDEKIEGIEIVSLNAQGQPLENTKQQLTTDALCIAVGLSPMHQLCSMINANVAYIAECGGYVPIVSDQFETSIAGVFAVGDATGIEEASSAMMEGYLVGLYMGQYCHSHHPQFERLVNEYQQQLHELRFGPYGQKTQIGLRKMKARWQDA